MRLYGNIYFNDDGISTSIRSMHLQSNLLGNINDNINGFNKVGYQRRDSVVSSFSEFVGVHGVSRVNDEEVGRVTRTKNPLDFAIGKNGYFQYKTPDGIKLTRDGRFKLDKDGCLLTQENYNVLSKTGEIIKLSKVPKDLKDLHVGIDGEIKVIDKEENKVISQGFLSVVSSEGEAITDVDVRQEHIESSNVRLQSEFFNLIPVRRTFEANRQLYMIQNDALTKTIQQLGSA